MNTSNNIYNNENFNPNMNFHMKTSKVSDENHELNHKYYRIQRNEPREFAKELKTNINEIIRNADTNFYSKIDTNKDKKDLKLTNNNLIFNAFAVNKFLFITLTTSKYYEHFSVVKKYLKFKNFDFKNHLPKSKFKEKNELYKFVVEVFYQILHKTDISRYKYFPFLSFQDFLMISVLNI